MVRLCGLFALCHFAEARRMQSATTVLAGEEALLDSSHGYLCRDGQGQPGQNYAALSGSRKDCRHKCDKDADCMGFEFVPEAPAWVQPCKLFGANVPQLGMANGTQYCLRTDFSTAPSEAVPGDGEFMPDHAWLAETLQVPLNSGNCKQLGGGGSKGASGAHFFTCDVEYGGSAVYPDLGMPTKLFTKVRTPAMSPNEFDVERQVYGLMQHLPDRVPMPMMLSGCRNHLVLESAGSSIDSDHHWTNGEVTAVLDSYAAFHASFWNISTEDLRLKTVEEWIAHGFGGVVTFPPEEVVKLMTVARLPEDVRDLALRLGNEVGYMKTLQYLLSSGHTLVQGDAHYGQILRVSDHDDDDDDNDDDDDDDHTDATFNLADFGWAHANHPAVDIGSMLPRISNSKNHEKHLKHYWEALTENVGCANMRSCSFQEFKALFKLGAFFRGTFKLGMLFFEDFSKPPKIDPSIFEDGSETQELMNWFEVVDSEMVDYLSQKINGQPASSLLSLSEIPAPNQAMVNALRERELAFLSETVNKPVDKL